MLIEVYATAEGRLCAPGCEQAHTMKFIVATYGTEGDARPLAALCRALMDAGHEARLLADAATLTGAQALGVATTALAGDIRGAFSPKHAVVEAVAGVADDEAITLLARVGRARPDLAHSIISTLEEIDSARAVSAASALKRFVSEAERR